MGRLSEYLAKAARKSRRAAPPEPLLPIAAAIPDELKRLPRWVGWKSEVRDGRRTKVPYDPRTISHKARANDPTTWGTFEQAWSWMKRTAGGIGFEFSGDGIVGVDLDKCRDPGTGTIEPWATEIIRRLDSYTEVSPSGAGVHILLRGKLPGKRCRFGNIEMYESGRYFCVTGHHVRNTSAGIEDRHDDVVAFYDDVFTQECSTTARNSGKQNRSIPPARNNRERRATELVDLIRQITDAYRDGDMQRYRAIAKKFDRVADKIEGPGWGRILRQHLTGRGYDKYEKQADRAGRNTCFSGTTISVEIGCGA